MTGRFDRQGFLGAVSEERLALLRVAIVGLGGGGSHIAQQLAHVGLGQFVLFDPDRIEESNLNRLVGATSRDVQKQEWKVRIAERMIKRVNSRARVDAHSVTWQLHAESLRDCDVIFGCIDSFIGRDELERIARRTLTPYIDIGMDVFENGGNFTITGQVALSMPGRACLHCMNVLRPDLIAREAGQYGAAGSRPQVIWPNGVLASTAVGVMMQVVVPWSDVQRDVQLLEYDGNSHEVRTSSALPYLREKTCPHFSGVENLGDPWFAIKKQEGEETVLRV